MARLGRSRLKSTPTNDFPTGEAVAEAICADRGHPLQVFGNTRRHNEGRRPRSDWLHRLIWSKSIVKDAVKFVLPDVLRQQISRAMHQFNRAPVPPLSEEARRIIIERLSDDIEQTEELLGEDLSAWKK